VTGLVITALRGALLGVFALPARPVHALLGAPPVNDRGVPLDDATWRMAWLERRVFGGLTVGTPAAARAAMVRSTAIVGSRPSAPVVVSEGRVPGGAPFRMYRPPGPPRPLLVYLHGGGWSQGSPATHDPLCRRLATEAGWTVLSLDYRLAPEHPFPAALDDTVAAVRWARTADLGALPDRLAIGGDSAGGNLAAAACLVLRDAGEPLPELQVLIYPGLDLRRGSASHRLFAKGFVLTARDIDRFQACYAAPVEDPRASPLLASSLAGLPPAIVSTAGFDPLRDEGEAYVTRLRESGVPVVHLDEPHLVHGFISMDGAVPAADRAVRRVLAAVSEAGSSEAGS
jgi:acetyl esterase